MPSIVVRLFIRIPRVHGGSGRAKNASEAVRAVCLSVRATESSMSTTATAAPDFCAPAKRSLRRLGVMIQARPGRRLVLVMGWSPSAALAGDEEVEPAEGGGVLDVAVADVDAVAVGQEDGQFDDGQGVESGVVEAGVVGEPVGGQLEVVGQDADEITGHARLLPEGGRGRGRAR